MNYSDGPEQASAPFRPINMDHIQNSSNGKQFRSPMAARKLGNSGSSKGMASLSKTHPLEEPTVFRLNTDFKIQMRQPSRQMGETVDENGCYPTVLKNNNYCSDQKMSGVGSRQHNLNLCDSSARSSQHNHLEIARGTELRAGPELMRISPANMNKCHDSHLADEQSSTVSFSFEAGAAEPKSEQKQTLFDQKPTALEQ